MKRLDGGGLARLEEEADLVELEHAVRHEDRLPSHASRLVSDNEGDGPRYSLRVEVVNSDGDIVATHKDEMKVEYKSLYVLGMSFEKSERDRTELLSRLAGSIAGLAR